MRHAKLRALTLTALLVATIGCRTAPQAESGPDLGEPSCNGVVCAADEYCHYVCLNLYCAPLVDGGCQPDQIMGACGVDGGLG